MADTWVTDPWIGADPEQDSKWEEYKQLYEAQEYKGRVVAPRPHHSVTSLPNRALPKVINHAQFPAFVNPQGIRYSKSGDLLVTLTVPGQYSELAMEIIGLMRALVSVDMTPYPMADPSRPISEQANWGSNQDPAA